MPRLREEIGSEPELKRELEWPASSRGERPGAAELGAATGRPTGLARPGAEGVVALQTRMSEAPRPEVRRSRGRVKGRVAGG